MKFGLILKRIATRLFQIILVICLQGRLRAILKQAGIDPEEFFNRSY